jgi:hypothetical protein
VRPRKQEGLSQVTRLQVDVPIVENA